MELHLPPRADRVYMLRTVLAAAESVLSTLAFSEDDTIASRKIEQERSVPAEPNEVDNEEEKCTSTTRSANDKFRIAQERHGRRIAALLRDDVPKKAAMYLHLPPDSCDIYAPAAASTPAAATATATTSGESMNFPTDPFGCVVLLLANHIIHCGMTGYDARTRSIIKMASVHILAKSMEIYGKNSCEDCLSTADSEDSYDVVLNADDVDGAIEKTGSTLSDYLEESWTNLKVSGAEITGEEVEIGTNKEEVDSSHPHGSNITEVKNEAAQPDKRELQADAKIKLRKKRHFDATRRFEEIEKSIATKWLQLLLASSSGKKGIGQTPDKMASSSKNNMIRNLKIGTAAVAAGTLLAVTGGMAAPGIAAGIAALGVGTTAVLTTVTSTAVMATLFGIGGGGLTAYKMKRRTDGLTEFRVRREGVASDASHYENDNSSDASQVQARPPELRTVVCISGWLRDKYDFQRPWGVTPSDPPLENKLEILKRFFSVHDPEKVTQAESVLSEFKGREAELWKDLEQYYGRDPDHLLPIEYEALEDIPLTKAEDEKLGDILGVVVVNDNSGDKKKKVDKKNRKAHKPEASESTIDKRKQVGEISTFLKENSLRRLSEAECATEGEENHSSDQQMTVSHRMKHFDDEVQPTSAWDYLSLYGGDLYTVTWQSEALQQICDYVNALARKLMKDASKEVLKQTALATLLSAVAWPSAVMKVADMIDEPWSLISLRSDEAGIELANCLLQSEEHKPVTLIGFSFGARIVYSCLRELARHQTIWEEQQVQKSSSTKLGSDVHVEYSREPASIVEDAILMGTPKFVYIKEWQEIRHVVAGRLINCYSRKDWILSLMFQIKNVTGIFRATCGTSPIVGVRGVENHDVSDIITSHENYCIMVQQILRAVGHGEPTKMMADNE